MQAHGLPDQHAPQRRVADGHDAGPHLYGRGRADGPRVWIGHSGDTTDVDYLESLLCEGVYLSLDRYPGRPPRPSWQQRNEVLKQLPDRGWGERLMVGPDGWAAAWLRATEDSTPVPCAWTSSNPEAYNPDGLLHISRVAIPHMLAIGITQEQIDLVTREVPGGS